MKTWLTYLAAAAMGLAFELTFRDSLFFVSSMNFMADIVMKLGAFIVFPACLHHDGIRNSFTFKKTRKDCFRMAVHPLLGDSDIPCAFALRSPGFQDSSYCLPSNIHNSELCRSVQLPVFCPLFYDSFQVGFRKPAVIQRLSEFRQNR